MSDPLEIAVLSLESPAHACAQLRMIAPFSAAAPDVRLSWAARIEGGSLVIDRAALGRADLLIVQRFFPHPRTRRLLDELCAAHVPLIYETDDLLVELPESNPHRPLARACAPEILALARRAEAVVVSTPRLAQAFAPLAKTVRVVPNRIDTDLFRFRAPQPASDRPVTIGYAGTPTHAADLALILPALRRVRRHFGRGVRFVFAGCAPPTNAGLEDVRVVPLEPSYAHWAALLPELGLDVALAPLAAHPFNEAKSPIKYLEQAACGIPGVYARLAPYTDTVRDGETGLLAGADEAEWTDALVRLVERPSLREELARAARDDVEARHALRDHARADAAVYASFARIPVARVAVSQPAPEVSIVMPVFERLDLTRRGLEALFAATAGESVEILVVDDGSSDDTWSYLHTLGDRVRPLRNDWNLGFAATCNRGAREARGKRLLFLNNDTLPERGFLAPLVDALESADDVAIVGALLLYPDGRVQHAGVAFSRPDGVPYHPYRGARGDHPAVHRRREPRAVTAACMLVRRAVFEALGGFDEGYRNGFEDVDLCLRAGAARHRIVYEPRCRLVHLEEQSPGRKAADGANLRRFLDAWRGRLHPDETSFLLEDGFIVRAAPSGAGRTIEPVRADDRVRWERLAALERDLHDGRRLFGAVAPEDPNSWPDDDDVRRWIRSLELGPPFLARGVEALARLV